MSDRYKAKLLILKLTEVTTDRGFTEAEARTAQAKIQTLMKTHNLKFRRPSLWSILCRNTATSSPS